MKINSYTKTGTKSQVSAPKVLTEDVNESLLMQAIHVYRNRKHPAVAKTQTRSEVSLVKQKWYRQKGTGNARHGAKSAPIFVGGGKAHGPKGVKRILSLPAKMKNKALSSALSMKAAKGGIVLADFSSLKKTTDASKIVSKIKDSEEVKRGKITVVLSDKNTDTKKAFSNVGSVDIQEYRNLNAYTVYFGGKLIFDKDIFENKSETKPSKKSTK